jgi:hypothetical protein
VSTKVMAKKAAALAGAAVICCAACATPTVAQFNAGDLNSLPLEFASVVVGGSTLTEVLQRLGHTYVMRADGGQPALVCYIANDERGSHIRLGFSFLGSGSDAELIGIEMEERRGLVDSWTARTCAKAPLDRRTASSLAGVASLGELRTAVVRRMGPPALRRESPLRIQKQEPRGGGLVETVIEIEFEAGRASLIRARRVETR